MTNRRQRSSMASSSTPVPKKEDQLQAAMPVISERQARMVDDWILKYHFEWSGLTLNPFYHELSASMLSPTQYARWLLDRASISLAIVEGAKRTADIVRNTLPGTEFSLLSIAVQDAKHFTEMALLAGLDINSAFRLSPPARSLVQLVEASTAPDTPPAVAVTAVWAYMLASWQAWELCAARVESLPTEFENVAKHITREAAIKCIHGTERVLERLLKSSDSSDQFEKAGKTFEEVAKRARGVLDHTMFISDSSNIPVCTCGRKGHLPEQSVHGLVFGYFKNTMVPVIDEMFNMRSITSLQDSAMSLEDLQRKHLPLLTSVSGIEIEARGCPTKLLLKQRIHPTRCKRVFSHPSAKISEGLYHAIKVLSFGDMITFQIVGIMKPPRNSI
ncbi:unnamed protein product [Agarophyton chilense]